MIQSHSIQNTEQFSCGDRLGEKIVNACFTTGHSSFFSGICGKHYEWNVCFFRICCTEYIECLKAAENGHMHVGDNEIVVSYFQCA